MASPRQPYVDTAPILTQADDTEDEEKEGLQSGPGGVGDVEVLTGISSLHAGFIVGVLFFINLLNYMDRFTVAGKDSVMPWSEQLNQVSFSPLECDFGRGVEV